MRQFDAATLPRGTRNDLRPKILTLRGIARSDRPTASEKSRKIETHPRVRARLRGEYQQLADDPAGLRRERRIVAARSVRVRNG
jgi:hypothetical protein